MTRVLARVLAFACVALGAVACTELLGVTNIPSAASEGGADSGVALDSALVVADASDGDAEQSDGATWPTILAAGQPCARFLAVDNENVYWTETLIDGTGSVSKCAISGCAGAPATLAATYNPESIVTDGTSLYWVGDNTIDRMSVSGGTVVDMLPSAFPPDGNRFGLAITGGELLFVDTATGDLVSTPIKASGATPTVIVHAGTQDGGVNVPAMVATDGVSAFYSTFGTTLAAGNLSGQNQSPTVLVSAQPNPTAVAVHNGYLYWLTTQVDIDVLRCPQTGCAQATVIYPGSGAGTSLVFAWGLAVDDTNVYWADGTNGTIDSCPIAGCAGPPHVLASGLNSPSGIIVDAKNIYWGAYEPNCSGGDVMMMAKP